MDPVTQIALGAVIGQTLGYKRLGGLAIAAGALSGLIPDLDVVPLPLLGPYAEWLYHRGITHGLMFGAILGPLMGIGIQKLLARTKPHARGAANDTRPLWVWICTLGLITHPLLDALTVYGTQLLQPFSDARFSTPALAVIDPGYTAPLLIALLLMCFAKCRGAAHVIGAASLFITSFYALWAYSQTDKAAAFARANLQAEGVTFSRFEVSPFLFQPWLKRVTVLEPHQARVGFVSSYAPQPIVWTCQQQADPTLLAPVLANEGGRILRWFSSDMLATIVTAQTGVYKTLQILDVRYGIPGSSLFGFWGLEAVVNTADQKNPSLVSLRKITLPRRADADSLKNLFKAALGQPNDFLPSISSGCR